MANNTTQYARICLRQGDKKYCDGYAEKVLLAGEPLFNTSDSTLAIGNGENKYKELPKYYVGGSVSEVKYDESANTLTIVQADGTSTEPIIIGDIGELELEVFGSTDKTKVGLTDKVGALDELKTNNKDSLVKAINEVKGNADNSISELSYKNGALTIKGSGNSTKTVLVNNFGNANVRTTGKIIINANCKEKEEALFTVGAGYEEGQRNAFEVLNDGGYGLIHAKKAIIGSNPDTMIVRAFSFAQGNGYASSEDDDKNWCLHRALGNYSHVEGANNTAAGNCSHAEGFRTNALGRNSHAEGVWTLVAKNKGPDVEGVKEYVYDPDLDNCWGTGSTDSAVLGGHAEGLYTEVRHNYAHAEGIGNVVSHQGAHVEGYYNKTSADYQHVSGIYNADNENALFIIGNGTSENNRANALEVLKDGTIPGVSLTVDDKIIDTNYHTSKLTLKDANLSKFLVTLSTTPLNYTNGTKHVIRFQLGKQIPIKEQYGNNLVPYHFDLSKGTAILNQEGQEYTSALCDKFIPVISKHQYRLISKGFGGDGSIAHGSLVFYKDPRSNQPSTNIVKVNGQGASEIFFIDDQFDFTVPEGANYMRYCIDNNFTKQTEEIHESSGYNYQQLDPDANLTLTDISINLNDCDLLPFCFETETETETWKDLTFDSQIDNIVYNGLTGELKIPGRESVFLNKPNLFISKHENYIYGSTGIIDISYKLDSNLAYKDLKNLTQTVDDTSSPPIVNTASGGVIAVSDSADRPLRGLRLLGKTTQNGTPSPDAPVPLVSAGKDGTFKVRVFGKNLIPFPYFDNSKTENGITFTNNGDGSVTINGTATAHVGFYFARGNSVIFTVYPGVTYTNNFPAGCRVMGYDRERNVYPVLGSAGSPSSISSVCRINELYIQVNNGTTFNNFTFFPQFGIEASTEYEPFKTPQTLTAQTPNGLPGVPVDSGGNYTDENGQQWVCDEIDFGRRKRVQRIGRIVSYAGETISGAFISSTGELSEGASVLYELDAPVETDLTAEELAQYAALHTNYPNTTVINDGGAGMEVKYVADTKNYIDKKFAELSAAIIAAGAT